MDKKSYWEMVAKRMDLEFFSGQGYKAKGSCFVKPCSENATLVYFQHDLNRFDYSPNWFAFQPAILVFSKTLANALLPNLSIRFPPKPSHCFIRSFPQHLEKYNLPGTLNINDDNLDETLSRIYSMLTDVLPRFEVISDNSQIIRLLSSELIVHECQQLERWCELLS